MDAPTQGGGSEEASSTVIGKLYATRVFSRARTSPKIQHMRRAALVTMIAGVFTGVMALGTLMTGWWWLSPYALMAAGALLILAAVLASVAGGMG